MPCCFYRSDRQPWMVACYLGDLTQYLTGRKVAASDMVPIFLDAEGFCSLLDQLEVKPWRPAS
jgi:hypothetical protein